MNIFAEYNNDKNGNDCYIYERFYLVMDVGKEYVLRHYRVEGSWTGEDDIWESYPLDGIEERFGSDVFEALNGQT